MSAKAILSASVSAPPAPYVEDVFSTFLYTGNGSTRTITNGIDLAGEGGLVWVKARGDANSHVLADTVRGAGIELATNSINGESVNNKITAFSSTGFTVDGSLYTGINSSNVTYCSWTFREAPKFFDVVTYTGNGSNRTIAHNLGSVPGAIWVKRTNTSGNWQCYHRSLENTQYMVLNSTAAAASGATRWNSTTPTSTVFSLGTEATVNASGGTYVAYLFAHDAGGFGDAGTDNVVSCGSYTGNGLTAGPQVTLGYEPQWVLRKNVTAARGGPGDAGSWSLVDNMRGMSQTTCPFLFANSGATEDTSTITTGYIIPNATGFVDTYTYPGDTYIYIAIRRGPMKTPESGTEVFAPKVVVGDGTGNHVISGLGFAPDFVFGNGRGGDVVTYDKLRGANRSINTNDTSVEANDTSLAAFLNDGYLIGDNGGRFYDDGTGSITWSFRRAPGFFDVVAFTGTGAGSFNHNLGVVPELIIVKQRATSGNSWGVYSAAMGNTHWLALQATQAAVSDNTMWNNTTPTNTVFSIGSTGRFSGTCIAYLFASAPGVSKVGSYTGTGTGYTVDVNCGFTTGARFVLIKRTDSTGDWFVWDTARGIISGNDPYLLLNSAAAEATGTDYIDPLSTGFQISSTAPAAINANGGTYIFLAIS